MGQDFLRARGDEQKEVRRAQIMDAALALYDEVGYDRVTFTKIAKGLQFSRINLYNYFPSKEELFLEIVRRAYQELLEDVSETLPHERCEVQAYMEAWTAVVARHPRTFGLFILMNTQVLLNVSEARREEFQVYLDGMVTQIAERVCEVLSLDERDAWNLVAHQLNYAMGLHPIATRIHGGDAASAFSEQYRAFLDVLLRGMGIS